MDIRIVGESIFDINADCIFYFVDNAFTDKDSMDLVSKSGDRILDLFSNISSIPTYEYKIIPAFDIKSTYISLVVLPKRIDNEVEEERVYNLFNEIYTSIKDREFNKLAFDLKRLENSYSSKHCEILKRFLKKLDKSGEDIVVFMCK